MGWIIKPERIVNRTEKSGFGSGCSGFGLGYNPFGFETKTRTEPNRITEFNSVQFRLDWIENTSQDFGLDSNSGYNLFQNLIQFQNESNPTQAAPKIPKSNTSPTPDAKMKAKMTPNDSIYNTLIPITINTQYNKNFNVKKPNQEQLQPIVTQEKIEQF